MAHALIVTAVELPNYINAEFVAQFSADVLQGNLQAATNLMLGWMEAAVTPPIFAPFPDELKMHTAAVAIYLLKSVVGMAPTSAAVADENIRIRYQDAERWGKDVGRGEVKVQGLVDSDSSDAGAILLYPTSQDPRGW